MANDFATAFDAIRDALVTIVDTAWNPDRVYINDFSEKLLTESATMPVAFVGWEGMSASNETPVTDVNNLDFSIAGIWEKESTTDTDSQRALFISQLEAELYGALHLGNYGSMHQVTSVDPIVFTAEERYGVIINLTVRVSTFRA